MNYEKIGNFIKEKRKEKNLTQKELATKIGITDKAISKWERGLGFPDVSLLEDLSKALNVSILELLKGEDIENNINTNETETFVKSTIAITQEETKRKRKRVINTIITSIIIGISLIIITLNIIQIKYLNIEYPFAMNDNYSLGIDGYLNKIQDNIKKIQNNTSIYKEEDKNKIINYLKSNLEEINNNHLLNSKEKKNTIKIKDIYVMEQEKSTNNKFRTNNVDILNILKEYTKDSLIDSYYNLYIDNYSYLISSSLDFHQESFLLSKYRLSLKQEDNIAYISYESICFKELKYQISDLLYLTELIVKVGDINE